MSSRKPTTWIQYKEQHLKRILKVISFENVFPYAIRRACYKLFAEFSDTLLKLFSVSFSPCAINLRTTQSTKETKETKKRKYHRKKTNCHRCTWRTHVIQQRLQNPLVFEDSLEVLVYYLVFASDFLFANVFQCSIWNFCIGLIFWQPPSKSRIRYRNCGWGKGIALGPQSSNKNFWFSCPKALVRLTRRKLSAAGKFRHFSNP